jgi:formylglycine-generating enzyme required for sulfatase activity
MALMAEMILVPGGVYSMGSDAFYPEESPRRKVEVDPFLIDRAPVTNAQYSRFVEQSGYRTTAETVPTLSEYPDADPAMLKPGSAVFIMPAGPVPLHDSMRWWNYVFGADWRHPRGPDSGLAGLEDHPVVHVAYADAAAYAEWAGKRLPTEAEWEFAARGGLDDREFAWGDTLAPKGDLLANYWQGQFPWQHDRTPGPVLTMPVGSFPQNGYGLYDMIGNVWEWTADWYAESALLKPASPCCAPKNPKGATEAASREREDGGAMSGRKVLKGGSHLCAENYCQRYRPAARYPQTIDTSTSHIGFRCARSA